jgi:ATP-dependent Clp protease adaptor protein ClpS
MAATGGTRASVETGGEVQTLPPWNVVLHNSWHPMSYVVWVLKRTLPGVGVRQATRLMLCAHREGRAVVKSCHRELAEHYAERIQARGLKATAEPPPTDP